LDEIPYKGFRILLAVSGRFFDVLDFLLSLRHIGRNGVFRDQNCRSRAIAPIDRIAQVCRVVLQSLGCSLNSGPSGFTSIPRPHVNTVEDCRLVPLPCGQRRIHLTENAVQFGGAVGEDILVGFRPCPWTRHVCCMWTRRPALTHSYPPALHADCTTYAE
jgi:hypothetical protein